MLFPRIGVRVERVSDSSGALVIEAVSTGSPGRCPDCRKQARAVKEAAPNATEVADRWHLLRNLSLAVEKTCHEHRVCLQKYAERAQRAEPRMPALEALPTTLIVDLWVDFTKLLPEPWISSPRAWWVDRLAQLGSPPAVRWPAPERAGFGFAREPAALGRGPV